MENERNRLKKELDERLRATEDDNRRKVDEQSRVQREVEKGYQARENELLNQIREL